jgi:hypothetical protein
MRVLSGVDWGSRFPDRRQRLVDGQGHHFPIDAHLPLRAGKALVRASIGVAQDGLNLHENLFRYIADRRRNSTQLLE